MKILLAALLLLMHCTATADIYKWTDKNGVVHYGDQQPETNGAAAAPKAETVELKPIMTIAPISTADTSEETSEEGSADEGFFAQWMSKAASLKADILQKFDQWSATTPVVTNQTITENKNTVTNKNSAKPNNEVEIFTTAWCGVCKKAKRWLNDRGIAYKEYDVEKDTKAAARMRKLGGGNSVPFAVINGKPLQGFNPNMYQAALRK
jgi:mycoredoxin